MTDGLSMELARPEPTSDIRRAQPGRVPDMPSLAAQDGLDKFQRHCANQGMKLLRMWVPDPYAPGFAEEAKRQAELLRNAPEEQEALNFIEAIMADEDRSETRRYRHGRSTGR